MFQRIVSVARGEEGNLVVADAGWGEIRVFDSGGEHVRTIGREGEGPGEFQSLSGAWPGSEGAAADHRIRAGGRDRTCVEDRGGGGTDILQVLGAGRTGIDPEFNQDARCEGSVAR